MGIDSFLFSTGELKRLPSQAWSQVIDAIIKIQPIPYKVEVFRTASRLEISKSLICHTLGKTNACDPKYGDREKPSNCVESPFE
jgi:hypothetical protein